MVGTFVFSGVVELIHEHILTRPWPKAAFRDDPCLRCGAAAVTASGLSFECVFFSGLISVLRAKTRRYMKDYPDSSIFTPLRLFAHLSLSLSSLFVSVAQHFHLLPPHLHTSQIFSFRLSSPQWVELSRNGSFSSPSLSLSFPLSLNLLHVHDTNTETDISPPASLCDIYHRAS